MNDHVIGALHKCGVYGEEGLVSFAGVTAGEEGGVFFSDAHIEVALVEFLFKNV